MNLIKNCEVSAANLHNLKAPTLLKHYNKLHLEDKLTWDTSYKEEYQGLVDIDTWQEITKEEYQASKHIFGNLLPTMAIPTIFTTCEQQQWNENNNSSNCHSSNNNNNEKQQQ